MSTGANFDPVARTAYISKQIMGSVRAIFQPPAEQFLTIMVPSKVITFEDYTDGLDPETGALSATILPLSTELNNAILCDDMPALSPVQLGPTGRSVSRSYATAISKLVPTSTTVGVITKDTDKLSPMQRRYDDAMAWLRKPLEDGRTRVEVYAAKQYHYTKVVEEKMRAFDEALKRANELYPDNRQQARAYYDQWVNENARTYRNLVQAAYMDWVVNGYKEEVEYYFAIVDVDTSLARVEQSLSAMRAAVVQDTDGAVEYSKVKLTPTGWAVYAKQKAQLGSRGYTPEWYTYEITRLEKLNSLLTAIKDKTGTTPGDPGKQPEVDDDLAKKITAYITASDDYAATVKSKGVDDPDSKTKETAVKDAKKEVVAALKAVDTTNVKFLESLSQKASADMWKALAGDSGLASTLISTNNKQIADYAAKRDALLNPTGTDPAQRAVDDMATEAGVPPPLSDPTIIPPAYLDYFTSISVDIMSSSSEDSSSSSASQASWGASLGYGLWGLSFGTSGEWSSTTAEAMSQMQSNNCKIRFDCMRVDIGRSWLRGELFYDSDLTVGENQFISPGFKKLRDLINGDINDETSQQELERYSQFPMYPTAFLLACNVVLEITGESTAIQTYFNSTYFSSKSQLSYGPFNLGINLGGSYSHSSTTSSSSCTATADGVRIEIKAPQIIGWISQMVPALPRLNPADQKSVLEKYHEPILPKDNKLLQAKSKEGGVADEAKKEDEKKEDEKKEDEKKEDEKKEDEKKEDEKKEGE
ncbi:hypothetical protein ABKN59_005191 [Abortiporus biennis]